ncbi:MAG: methyl-accepting chemotaxis protein [Candidatus Odinarchaeota archaeon]|nr:methyl-accepting chemotaxis protein [Candidatus Odinarchaeota archaeon]
MGLFKKDWEKWEELSQKWEKAYNDFSRGADKSTIRKILFYAKKIEDLTKKTKNKLHPDYHNRIMWLVHEIRWLAEYQLKHGFNPDYMWSLNSYLSDMISLMASITHWLHYGTVAPHAIQRYARIPTTSQTYGPYYSNPYSSVNYSLMPTHPMYYSSAYYRRGRYRAGHSGLVGLFALFALRSMLSSAVAHGGRVDTSALYNAATHLKESFEASKPQLASLVGQSNLKSVESRINELYNMAVNAARKGKLSSSDISRLNQMLGGLTTQLQPAIKAAVPMLMASMKTLSSAIEGVLSQISRKGFVSQTDYYQLRNLYGQLMSYLNTLPPEVSKMVDPNILNNLRQVSRNYDGILQNLQRYVGKPVDPNVLNSLRGITTELNRNASIFLKQVEPQARNLIEQASRISTQMGQQVNPFSSGLQQTIESVSRTMFRQQKAIAKVSGQAFAQTAKAFEQVSKTITPSIVGGLANLSRESQRIGNIVGDIISSFFKKK